MEYNNKSLYYYSVKYYNARKCCFVIFLVYCNYLGVLITVQIYSVLVHLVSFVYQLLYFGV